MNAAAIAAKRVRTNANASDSYGHVRRCAPTAVPRYEAYPVNRRLLHDTRFDRLSSTVERVWERSAE